jgi:uncharacterized protein with GYD domain
MPHYLFRASYTQQGVQGIMAEGGTARVTAVEQLVSSLGGRVEAQYWAFGEEDYLLIAELPDNVAAAALTTKVAASGIAGIQTTVLLTPQEVDEAAQRQVSYRPPAA